MFAELTWHKDPRGQGRKQQDAQGTWQTTKFAACLRCRWWGLAPTGAKKPKLALVASFLEKLNRNDTNPGKHVKWPRRTGTATR